MPTVVLYCWFHNHTDTSLLLFCIQESQTTGTVWRGARWWRWTVITTDSGQIRPVTRRMATPTSSAGYPVGAARVVLIPVPIPPRVTALTPPKFMAADCTPLHTLESQVRALIMGDITWYQTTYYSNSSSRWARKVATKIASFKIRPLPYSHSRKAVSYFGSYSRTKCTCLHFETMEMIGL